MSSCSNTVRRLEHAGRHLGGSGPGSAGGPPDTPNFLDNELVQSATNDWYAVHDPSTNQVVTRVPLTTADELQAAVASAEKAWPAWRTVSLLSRQQILFRYVQIIRENFDRLARSITTEQGKTLTDALGDVFRGLQVAEAACNRTGHMMGEVLEVAKHMETKNYRLPLGVVAAICPFSKSSPRNSSTASAFEMPAGLTSLPDFPAMIPLWSIPVATVTGNCLILKPSERAPGAAMILAELARDAGFPPGVLNVIHGTHDTVNFILDAPAIKAISFVGSNKAGEYIYTRGSANGKRVQANLGAKNHAVLLPDANMDDALNGIAGAAFGAAGQRCMALSTLVTVGGTEKLLPKLASMAKSLKVGNGFEEGVDVGPVISPQSLQRIEDIIASAEKEGATILLDGRGVVPKGYPRGNWVRLYHLGLESINSMKCAC